MTTEDKRFRRQIFLVLIPIGAVAIWSLVSNQFAIRDVQEHKQDKIEAMESAHKYWTDVNILVESKMDVFDTYVIKNDIDKIEFKNDLEVFTKEMEGLKDAIEELAENFNPVRGDSGPKIYEEMKP